MKSFRAARPIVPRDPLREITTVIRLIDAVTDPVHHQGGTAI
jgi:hypothetical protein